MVPTTLLQAAIDHAHSAAFAIRIRNIVLDLAALEGKLGIPFDVHCAGGSSIPKLIASVAHKLTTGHLKGGSLVTSLAVHDHRAALIAGVILDTAVTHLKVGIAHQHDAGRRKVITIAVCGERHVILTDNAALHDNMSAVFRVDSAAIRVLKFALLDNAARHGKRSLVSRHVDDTRIDGVRSAVAHNGLVREHNRSPARNNGALVVATTQGHFPRQLEGCPLGNIDQYGEAAFLCQDGIGLIRRDLNHLPGRNRERGAKLHVLFQGDDGFLVIGGLVDQILKGLGAVIAHGTADAVIDGLARVDDIDAKEREVLRAFDVVHAVFDCDLFNRAAFKHTRGYFGEAAPDRHILHATYAREGRRANGSHGIRNGKLLRQRAVIEGVVANCLKCPGKLDGDVALDKGPLTETLQAVAKPHDLNRCVAERIVRNVLKRGQIHGRLQIFALVKSPPAHLCHLA